MKAYLVDLIDAKDQVRQRIWVKTHSPVTLTEMEAYISKLNGLKVQSPKVVSIKEKTLPSNIRQELVEKVFPVFTQ